MSRSCTKCSIAVNKGEKDLAILRGERRIFGHLGGKLIEIQVFYVRTEYFRSPVLLTDFGIRYKAGEVFDWEHIPCGSVKPGIVKVSQPKNGRKIAVQELHFSEVFEVSDDSGTYLKNDGTFQREDGRVL